MCALVCPGAEWFGSRVVADFSAILGVPLTADPEGA